MIKFILLGILLVFTVHQAFAQNVTMTTDSSEYYFLIGDDVAVGAMVNSSFPNTLTGNIEYTTVVTVQQPGMQTVNTNVGNSPVTINPGVEQLLIQFGSYQTETTLQTTLHVTYSDVEQYELVHDFTVHIVADDSQKNNQNDPSQSSSQQSTIATTTATIATTATATTATAAATTTAGTATRTKPTAGRSKDEITIKRDVIKAAKQPTSTFKDDVEQ